jgi:hypothetical protein
MFALQKLLKTCADHFAGDAKHHATMAKAWETDSEQHASHNERGEACKAMADKCASLGDKCSKADSIGDLGKLFGDKADEMQPSNVSIVAPDAPARGRLVLRAGQREVPADAVPVEFRKLVSIEDGTESETV